MNKIAQFIIDHWVSWLIEIVFMAMIAFYTIQITVEEARKTGEQTREMIAQWDARISKYASDKTKAIDKTVSSSVNSVKSVTTDDVKGFLNKLKTKE